MNVYMNDVAMSTFSSFDTGNHPSDRSQPERFYHGFVLGLLVDIRDNYEVLSNRESGFGRYDVVLVPREKGRDAFVMEFKVFDDSEESGLEDTVAAALRQIDEKTMILNCWTGEYLRIISSITDLHFAEKKC